MASNADHQPPLDMSSWSWLSVGLPPSLLASGGNLQVCLANLEVSSGGRGHRVPAVDPLVYAGNLPVSVGDLPDCVGDLDTAEVPV
jgi:hypothetical protein